MVNVTVYFYMKRSLRMMGSVTASVSFLASHLALPSFSFTGYGRYVDRTLPHTHTQAYTHTHTQSHTHTIKHSSTRTDIHTTTKPYYSGDCTTIFCFVTLRSTSAMAAPGSLMWITIRSHE